MMAMVLAPMRHACCGHLRRHVPAYVGLVLAVSAAALASITLPTRQVCTIFVTVLMLCLWLSGEPDMAVVSLLPVALFPPLGVVGSKVVAGMYFSDVVFLLLGSYLLSIALQEVDGHTRLALKFISALPGDPRVVLAGFMAISAMLSMFMSNTATASVMCPLAASFASAMREAQEGGQQCIDEAEAPRSDDEPLERYLRRVMLGIAYSCSIGGAATITGTGTNVAFSRVYHELQSSSVSWCSWVLLGLPLTVTMLVVCWCQLTLACGGLGLPRGYRIPMSHLRKRYEELPRVTRAQATVYAAFVMTMLGWMFREPGFMPGWADLLPDPEMVSDGTLVMTTGMALFFAPAHGEGSAEGRTTILHWSRVRDQLPMGLLFLIGGGSAISLAFKESGLSASLSSTLSSFEGCPDVVVVLIVCSVAAGMSQMVSDVATALVLLPIAHSFAVSLNKSPLTTMIPVTFSCSLPFTLPISTPPNAIAYQVGALRQAEMVRIGLPMVFLGLGVVLAMCFSFGLTVLGA
uniref:Citrate transporter-like domain-containing protein n=1 Tax=Alexandrium monilatum TaxID=311494 RepID=A0A6T0WVE4_9DINO|mmetsp:Transcript_72128/g.227964  ORF Transcript_72128/g.227964 Transcript_72128/m.227964 type:complete len:519 (+) Transcript_72128:46-1602(+)